MKKVLIFGPPGIGKSTICLEIAKRGFPSVDLENINKENRRKIFNSIPHGIIGAADLPPKENYENTIKVLLVLEQEAYEKRRATRDSKNPSKLKQPLHNIMDWYNCQYDYILKADAIAVDSLINIYNDN